MDKQWYKSIIYYTGIINSNNRNRELAIIGKADNEYVVSWYNNKTKRFGVEFFVEKTEDGGFIYNGEKYER